MHFLSSSLTGSALDVIKNIPVTADNFAIAWKTLVSRYENKRRLIEVHAAALHNLPSVSRESALELNELRDKANRAIAALRNLKRSSEDILNDLLVFHVSQKLDPTTRKAWKLRGGDETTIPSYDDLDRFIENRARALEELALPNFAKTPRSPRVTSATASAASSVSCPLCKSSHFINKCPQFIKSNPNQRAEIITTCNRCLNCLSAKHTAKACPSKYTCRTCQLKHHSMLHVDSDSTPTKGAAAAKPDAQSKPTTSVAALNLTRSAPSRPRVLLATARVQARSSSGRAIIVRALIDPGSEITLMTERLAQSLKVRRIRLPISISAIGGVNIGTCRHAADLFISPRDSSQPVLATVASILTSLTSYSPAPVTSENRWTHIADLHLADPDPLSADPIDIILGADLYSELLLDGVRKGESDQPMAQNTILGWILSGSATTSSISRRITVQHCTSSQSLDQILQKFWEIEELPTQTLLTPEDQQCEEHFISTHSRDSEGRYTVRLPFKRGPPIDIGYSDEIAKRLVQGLTRRFKINPQLKQEYSDFLREYETLGHMRTVLSPSSASPQCVYIPHHPVVRESSVTTRLRVVFNASSRTTNGSSLNDHLLTGPKLQTDLAAVVLRWRQFRYVYAADIEKMYRQIRIDPRDADYQRIVWLHNDDLREYQLLTVTYGTASAPFLALRVIRQLVQDEGNDFPLAVSILRDNIYVDDVLFGADDIPSLKQVRDQVCAVLKRGCFDLRKWISNSPELLSDIAVANHGLACDKTLQESEQIKILGISWSPATDVFQFQVSFPFLIPSTKRAILSTVARLFDPLGWGTPVTITAKILLQKLWQLKIDWDETIPSPLEAHWISVKTSLANLNGVSLARWVQRGSDTVSCELHGFSDASTTSYAAAVYIRIVSASGDPTSTLLIGKAKVAPLKSLSIPRLELSAAVLLSRLMEFVRSSLCLTAVPCFCWTDSTVVLSWVSQHPSRWKTFVANRVSDIQSRIPSALWKHVPTEDNPADCASRGILGSQLAAHKLWWQGPTWLRQPAADWPKAPDSSSVTSLEQQSCATHVITKPEPWDLATRYSSWPKLLRVTAYVMRFINRLRHRVRETVELEKPPSALSAIECQRARNFWLQRIQAEIFPIELKALNKNQSISTKSRLLSLNPFLSEDKLIRVGGRLSNALIPLSKKHPIILAAHPLVEQVVQHAHLRSLHAGTQLTLATLRRDFWILRARSIVRAIINRCVICTREKAATPTQLMGSLPSVRVNPPARAFLHCGIDYAGPVSIRSMSGRGVKSRKAYIAVFICMATRAIHLELVESYATSAFLGAYSRFCSRRGLPASMYSDNGTTFAGADRELTCAFRAAVRDPNFLNFTAADKTSWHFIPPSAPHFGGLWEAGVKSVKHHLRRVVGSHTLTFEEFITVLCQVEACLNSRPLAPLTDTVDDYEPLTPGHFLIGSALTTPPEPSLLNINENRLSRWQLVRQLTERFWRLWQNDYINTLQQRAKWQKTARDSIRVGQLVLLRNPLLPPCKWELGRITKCHVGADHLARVITVKTASGEYKRPLVKVCILPVDIEPKRCK